MYRVIIVKCKYGDEPIDVLGWDARIVEPIYEFNVETQTEIENMIHLYKPNDGGVDNE